MEALWLENQKLSYREDIPVPIPGKGEALIKVTKAGICSTDMELIRGYYPYTGIPGHEFVGIVEKVNGDPKWIGKKVVGEINITCGKCSPCLMGLKHHCENRRVLGIKDRHGVFCEYTTLPVRNLYQVPADVSDQSAVFIEPLAAALEILEQVNFRPTDRILLIGAGRLGQLIARVVWMTGCELVVVTRYADQQKMLEEFNLTCINESQIPNREFDIVIEATGSQDGLKSALQAVRARGIVILKSTYKGTIDINPSIIVVNEINLVGSRCGPFKPAIRILKKRQINPMPLISASFNLSNGLESFEFAASKGIFKVLFDIH